MPFAREEEAVEEMMSEPPVMVRPLDEDKPAVDAPPVKDEVAAPVTAMRGVIMEEVAESPETVVEPVMETSPETAKVVPGVVVPMPTLPDVFSITSRSVLIVSPPEIVEVEELVTDKLVIVVEPLFKPPPPPQLMQAEPTWRLPPIFK